jgi:hypothetical protein
MAVRSNVTNVLDREIAQLEQQLTALRSARAALGGGGSSRAGRSGRGRRPGQRNFTSAQRAEQSRKMRLYWAKRRREQQK